MLDKIKGWFGKGQTQTGGEGKSALQQNAEKALDMKRQAGPQTSTPTHETSHQGGVPGGQVGYTDTAVGAEPTFTPNLKRSHNARSGDA